MSGFVPCLCKAGSTVEGLPVRKRKGDTLSARLLRVARLVWFKRVRHFAIRHDYAWAIYQVSLSASLPTGQLPALVKSGLTKDAAIMLLMYKD